MLEHTIYTFSDAIPNVLIDADVTRRFHQKQSWY